jgi:hypothetical protein
MDSIAATYGLKIEGPVLGGIFTLLKENRRSTRLRNLYIAHVKAEETMLPEIIDEVRWLKLEQAIELLSFEHINFMIERVLKHRDSVWGGSVMTYKENEVTKAKVSEEFYRLFECR